MESIKISVCIPVYKSEKYLKECLDSLVIQTFKNFEIVLVNDCSPKKLGCKKIVDQFIKENPNISFKYLEHKENKGAVETRRTAVLNSSGEYVFILDSDDYLVKDSLSILFKKITATDADIVEGKFRSVFENKVGDIVNDSIFRPYKVKPSFKEDMEFKKTVFGKFMAGDITLNLWKRLYKKSLYIKALNNIKPIKCVMFEDFIQNFWLMFYCNKFIKIKEDVYRYRTYSGITKLSVDSLDEWKRNCVAMDVINNIKTFIEENEIQVPNRTFEYLEGFKRAFVNFTFDRYLRFVRNKVKFDKNAYDYMIKTIGEDNIKQANNYFLLSWGK